MYLIKIYITFSDGRVIALVVIGAVAAGAVAHDNVVVLGRLASVAL